MTHVTGSLGPLAGTKIIEIAGVFAPVLCFREAIDQPHGKARGSLVEIDGMRPSAPAPRVSRTPACVNGGPPEFGAETEDVVSAWGFSDAEIANLKSTHAVGRRA